MKYRKYPCMQTFESKILQNSSYKLGPTLKKVKKIDDPQKKIKIKKF